MVGTALQEEFVFLALEFELFIVRLTVQGYFRKKKQTEGLRI